MEAQLEINIDFYICILVHQIWKVSYIIYAEEHIVALNCWSIYCMFRLFQQVTGVDLLHILLGLPVGLELGSLS